MWRDCFSYEVVERFFWKVRFNLETGCWDWEGAITKQDGYGLYANPRRGQRSSRCSKMAHRASWEMFRGDIPEGMQIDHLCKNRKCVNPDHLEPVTPAENGRRSTSFSAINGAKTHCIHGHPFTPENTYVYTQPNGNPGRACRTCAIRNATERNRRVQKEKAEVR